MHGESTSINMGVVLNVDPLFPTAILYVNEYLMIQVDAGAYRSVADTLYVPDAYSISSLNDLDNFNIPTNSYIFGLIVPANIVDVEYTVQLSVSDVTLYLYGYYLFSTPKLPFATCALGIVGSRATAKVPAPTGPYIEVTISVL